MQDIIFPSPWQRMVQADFYPSLMAHIPQAATQLTRPADQEPSAVSRRWSDHFHGDERRRETMPPLLRSPPLMSRWPLQLTKR